MSPCSGKREVRRAITSPRKAPPPSQSQSQLGGDAIRASPCGHPPGDRRHVPVTAALLYKAGLRLAGSLRGYSKHICVPAWHWRRTQNEGRARFPKANQLIVMRLGFQSAYLAPAPTSLHYLDHSFTRTKLRVSCHRQGH